MPLVVNAQSIAGILPATSYKNKEFDGESTNGRLLGIRLFPAIAFKAVQVITNTAGPSQGSGDPWPKSPGGIVPDMLPVAAFEPGHPVTLLVFMETGYCLLHGTAVKR